MRERGSATIEFTWLTLLLLVPFLYALLAVFETQRAAYAVNAASAAAARAFHQSDPQAAEVRARHAAAITLRDFEVDAARVEVSCPTTCFTPGSSVEVTVAARQPLPFVPDAWGTSLAAIDVDSTHVEPYGSYRAAR